MKTSTFFWLLIVAALAGAGGWIAAKRSGASPKAGAGEVSPAGTVYTCSMHPQVRQPRPGSCPFCGMALAPLSSAGASDLPAGSVMLSTNRINAIHVQSVPVRRQTLRRSLRVAGVIDDNDSRHRILSAYVAGRIDVLHVNFVGAEVRAGQPLASIYSPMLLAAEREYAALARRAAVPGAGSDHEEHAQLLAGARQRLLQLGLAPAQIDALPAKTETDRQTEILAPISGTVVNRMAYEGAYVMEGEKLFEIADFATMWFRFDAYERDLAWLQAGQEVEVSTPSVPGRVFRAPIAFIDPNLNDPTRSAKVRVELPNPLVETNGQSRRLLLHKLYAEGVVQLASAEVTAVPRSAVLAPGRPYVFVDQGGGIYEQRLVKLGRAGDDAWEVLGGVKEGERVVTSGNLLIDAQAQLDNATSTEAGEAARPGVSSADGPAESWPALSASELTAATNFLAQVAGVGAALAADDLNEFNRRVPTLAAPAATMGAALTNAHWAALAQAVATAVPARTAAELKAARKAFHALGMAAADLSLAVQRATGPTIVRTFQCPMVKQSFPGAPKVGRWLQLGAEVRNPFFGADMLDCGTEVKP